MGNQQKSVLEEGVYLCNRVVFKDEETHEYNIECFDGYAIAKRVDKSDKKAPAQLKLEYPKRSDILAKDERSSFVLSYRGLFDLCPNDITFGDIMLAYGKIV